MVACCKNVDDSLGLKNARFFCLLEEYSAYMNNARKVMHELFTVRAYSKHQAPLYEPMPENYSTSETPRMKINYMLTYLKVFDLDAEKQMLSSRMEMTISWRDPRLAWDVNEFAGVKSILTTTDVIWLPDSTFSNSAKLEQVNAQAPKFVRIFSNGTIRQGTAYYAQTTCDISANTFPFDRQNCTLPILSLNMEMKWIDLKLDVLSDGAQIWGNGEWIVVELLPIIFPPEGTMEIVGFSLIIKRVPNFYVYVIALPCFLLTMLSVIGMFWSQNFKKQQLEKLSIGLTSLVSMTVLLEMLATAIPKTEVFPLLGIYVVCCVGIITLACMTVVIYSQASPVKLAKVAEKEKRTKEDELTKNRTQLLADSLKGIEYDG
ncbi:unnamed protein product, partial [Mesorhabditis belari]|uniref:Uncharacterized protein n=1 Tax=Mesorhabditis belari TaxID=2138241 RepID=A0AAF3J3W0_9BILA